MNFDFELMIENKYPVEFILDKYDCEIMVAYPHIEVVFNANSSEESFKQFSKVIKELTMNDINYVKIEDELLEEIFSSN